MKSVKAKYIGNIDDFTGDYPVSEYTKKSGIKVKAHERGESERYLGNYAKSKKYPGKYIRIIKGKVFIEYRSVQAQSGRGTEKAVNVGGIWIPRSQVWYDSPHATHANIYVSEWFYPKLERKEIEHEVESLNRQIQSTEESIEKNKKSIKKGARFSTEDPTERLKKLNIYIKEDEELLKSIKKQKEERTKWLKENLIDDFIIKKAIGKYIGPLVNDSGYDDWKVGKKGKWITVRGTHLFILEGEEKKQAVLDKIKLLKKTPLPSQKKEEKEEAKKKKEPSKRTLSTEEKQRRELEARAKKYKRPPDLSKREKAIQKLIEETGYERERAEAVINEKMGKEELKKEPKKEPTEKEKPTKPYKTPKEIEQKRKQISNKVQKLKEKNKKIYSADLINALIAMITDYLITGNENTSQFVSAFLQIKAHRQVSKEQKESLLQEIQELRNEIRSFHEKKDLIEDLTYDSINNDELNDITLDFYNEKGDFTILHGPITRAGAFEYEKNDRSVIYYKDWDNIKKVFKKHDYIPLKATIEKGAHHSSILGYATNWKPNDQTEQMFADVVLFNDINEVTSLLDPESGYSVSIGFKDRIENGNIQILEYVDHLAMSLLNLDKDRCSTVGGKSCYAKQKEVNN